MDEMTRLTISTAIRVMFDKGWVDICAIDKCLNLAGIIPVAREYKHLHALHCVHFRDMPRELADRIPAMLGATFDGLNIEDLINASQPAIENNGGGAIKKLLSLAARKN